MNTILKPMIKAIEFSITLRNSWPSFDLSSSTPAPEISDTYPGTKGSTHGDRNEISPATKAARGRGRLDIKFILRKISSQFSVLSSQFSVLSSQFSVLSSQFSVLSSQNRPMPEPSQMLQKSNGSLVEKRKGQFLLLWRLFC